jgi:PhnB protein
MTKPIPDGFTAVTPYLIVSDAPKEIDFLVSALGGVVEGRLDTPTGQVMHALVRVDGAPIMLGSAMPPEMEAMQSMLFIYVTDVDARFARAAAYPGAAVQTPVTDQFWGDRCGSLTSPNGVVYWIASQKEQLTHEEIGKRASAMYG